MKEKKRKIKEKKKEIDELDFNQAFVHFTMKKGTIDFLK